MNTKGIAETRLVERLLRTKVGPSATFRQYDRSLKTPMNFVIDEAQRQLNDDFDVYWIDGGLPELFSLTGFSKNVIAYNTRYVELLYLVRKIVVYDHLASMRQELAERICLRVMAEFAMRHGKAEWAVRAFLQSIIGEDVRIADTPGTALLDLEAQPIGEAYMATWFFGLAHEAGHLRSVVPGATQFRDTVILEALESALESWPHYPDALKKETLAKAKAGAMRHGLSIEQLRSEAQADVFAVAILLKTTFEIMRKVAGEFRIEQFIAEMHIFLNLVVILERCQRMASVADSPEALDTAAREQLALHPVSFGVRARMIQLYLGHAVAGFLFHTDQPSTDQEDSGHRLVADICNSANDAIAAVDAGLAKAMRFALFPEERSINLMSQFARQLMTSKHSALDVFEAGKILTIAESFGIRSEAVQALDRVVHARRGQQAAT